jgi:siroheme synthase
MTSNPNHSRTLMAHGTCTLVGHGTCTLVGAGPGDPELLTLKAVKAIAQATVLLVDDLVSDEIVAMRRRVWCMWASAAVAKARRRPSLKNS